MKYMGSKSRVAKDILPIILRGRKENQIFVDLFCGGCNLIDKVNSPRIANDSNFYLIEMWKALQKGWEPPDFVSEDLYKDIRTYKEKYPPYLVGFVGLGCSYASKWFGGYARSIKKLSSNPLNKSRNYASESKRNLLKQICSLKDVCFYNLDYRKVPIPNQALIYCDPPYKGTTQYGDKFDHDSFWEYCRILSKSHSLFVSEYSAPEDFISVWEKKIISSLTADTGAKTGTEKLFVLNTK